MKAAAQKGNEPSGCDSGYGLRAIANDAHNVRVDAAWLQGSHTRFVQ